MRSKGLFVEGKYSNPEIQVGPYEKKKVAKDKARLSKQFKTDIEAETFKELKAEKNRILEEGKNKALEMISQNKYLPRAIALETGLSMAHVKRLQQELEMKQNSNEARIEDIEMDSRKVKVAS